MKKHWTLGDLKQIGDELKTVLEPIELCGTWSGVCIGIDRETNQPVVQLSITCDSRLQRWLYNRDLRRFPKHPSALGGYRVTVEARGRAYLGGPPPSLFDRTYDTLMRILAPLGRSPSRRPWSAL